MKRPYIIAEIGVNHGGSMVLAERMICEAARAGASAAKFQSYKAGKISCVDSPSYWDREKEPTASQYELFKKYDMFDVAEYAVLAGVCLREKIDFLCTPFDLEAVEFLAPLVPIIKIASADITNVPLLRACAAHGKPVFLSTGAASLPEIEFAVETLFASGGSDLTLLHCVLNYPTPAGHAQLSQIAVLRRVFPRCKVGYSDHVVPSVDGMPAMELAFALGAEVLEKHFTYDKALPGNDHYHSMDAADLSRFSERCRSYVEMVGDGGKNLEHEMQARRHARRSIVAAVDIKAGEMFTARNLTAKRPAHGLSPVHWDEVLGRRAAVDVRADIPLTWAMVI